MKIKEDNNEIQNLLPGNAPFLRQNKCLSNNKYLLLGVQT